MAKKQSWLDRLFGPDLTTQYETELREAREIVSSSNLHVEMMKESIRELSLYLEDLNWIKLEGWEENKGFDKKIIEENSDRLRALVAANPTIKKAVNARFGYIWGRDVRLEGKTEVLKRIRDENSNNQRVLFNKEAQWALEVKLNTEGNIWAVRNVRNNEVTIIPIEEIKGWVLDEFNPTRVTYWYREWISVKTNFATGEEKRTEHKEFYPAFDAPPSNASSIDGIKINRNYVIVHAAVNRQDPWVLGLPDILAAMFWTKAHKELFEAGTTFVKAQGKYAAKVIAKTGQGGQNAAATLRDTARRDPTTGEVLDAGGTAVLTGGLDYQLMGKMSGGVDFGAFEPVAGLIAGALGIPLHVLLSDSDNGDVSLEQSTVAEMAMRQEFWSNFYKNLFGNKNKIDVIWPKIKTEPEYRRIQSLEISNRTNSLHPNELRLLTLEAYGIEGDPNEVPKIDEQPEVAIAKAVAKIKADADIRVAKSTPSSVPEQGVDAKVGKLSTGADAKDARDNPLDGNVQGQ